MDKIFVSQSILDHQWVTLKVEPVSFWAQFFCTGFASQSLWNAQARQRNDNKFLEKIQNFENDFKCLKKFTKDSMSLQKMNSTKDH